MKKNENKMTQIRLVPLRRKRETERQRQRDRDREGRKKQIIKTFHVCRRDSLSSISDIPSSKTTTPQLKKQTALLRDLHGFSLHRTVTYPDNISYLAKVPSYISHLTRPCRSFNCVKLLGTKL